ncbi:DUF4097 family beta strand repeat-containing protein [Clostridium sp. HBUAS56017]|uniref:DUF4097 family beta strand repeat-containing protein n=1 Tax=Clostridium sp. HBUAS56017 TaxID=2571128 RepID=UPI0011778CF3|nr:DUF4097 family beta strand repeat-containing protein [Clostridium sp. HBUAS56017]
MKKFMPTKVKISLIILAIISLCSYLSAAIVLFNSGYSLSSYFSDWDSDFRWNFGWNNHYNSSGTVEKDFSPTVQNINIESISHNLSIQSYDGSTIKVNIDGHFDDNNNYTKGLSRFDITDNDVNILTNTALRNSNFHLNIYIPKTYKNNISLKSLSGSININGLELTNLLANTTSGDIILKNTNVNTVSLESKSGKIDSPSITSNNSKFKTLNGNIYLGGILGDSDVNSTSGSIKLKLSNLGNISNFSSISSDIDLTIPKEVGYTVSFSTTTGTLNGRNKNVDLNKNDNISLSNGDGSKSVTVKTTSGDLSVK